ncbi:MAG: SAF domain-containing protein [Clostridium celatum]|nr:SAF domain-containing protein [Clostridium celatum]
MKIGKKTGVMISLFIAIALFFGLIILQQNLLAPNGTSKVYVANKTIEKGTVLDSQNLNTLFTKTELNNEAIIEGAIYTEDELLELEGKILSRDMLKGEGLSSLRVVNKDDILANSDYVVEIGINSGDISEVVGGILREGDLVNISSVDPVTKESSLLLDNVYIDKAFSSDGTRIARTDSMAAARVNVLVTSKEAEANLNKAIELGGIKISKIR